MGACVREAAEQSETRPARLCEQVVGLEVHFPVLQQGARQSPDSDRPELKARRAAVTAVRRLVGVTGDGAAIQIQQDRGRPASSQMENDSSSRSCRCSGGSRFVAAGEWRQIAAGWNA